MARQLIQTTMEGGRYPVKTELNFDETKGERLCTCLLVLKEKT